MSDNNNNFLLTTPSSKHPLIHHDSHNPATTMTLIIKSWVNVHKSRYIILLLCSPLIIPIVCVSFPFICAAEVCFRIFRQRRPVKVTVAPPETVVVGPPCHVEVSLMERYLEDQLGLAIEIIDECGDLGLGYYGFVDDDEFHMSRSSNSLS